jgi:hypothetical protein
VEEEQEALVADLPGQARAVDKGVAVLRKVIAIRNGNAHSGGDSYKKAQRARRDLGLPVSSTNWGHDWNRIRQAEPPLMPSACCAPKSLARDLAVTPGSFPAPESQPQAGLIERMECVGGDEEAGYVESDRALETLGGYCVRQDRMDSWVHCNA